jgi:hypothetical protein
MYGLPFPRTMDAVTGCGDDLKGYSLALGALVLDTGGSRGGEGMTERRANRLGVMTEVQLRAIAFGHGMLVQQDSFGTTDHQAYS